MRFLSKTLCLLSFIGLTAAAIVACTEQGQLYKGNNEPAKSQEAGSNGMHGGMELPEGTGAEENTLGELNLIPKPVSAVRQQGEFVVNKDTVICYYPRFKSDAEFFAEYLKSATGFALKIKAIKTSDKITRENAIYLTDYSNRPGAAPVPGVVNYEVSVTPKRIVVAGQGNNNLGVKETPGVFYGLMTLRQLLPVQIESKDLVKNVKWTIPACKIVDKSKFRWRGMHLDVSRHFYTPRFIKKFIDIIALHKMNVFHWHLIDDGGWRLEIKKYPKLTSVGAWRNASTFKWQFSKIRFGDDIPKGEKKYGGFYTQDQVKEIVAYAAKRHIIVVPEIEMPGHVLPAIAAYPELACKFPKGVKVRDPWKAYKQNNYCAANPKVYQFNKDVLDETMKLFPSKYIHIGGDEVRKVFWDACTKCRALRKKEGMRNSEELQSYFIKKIDKYITSKGRIMVGWDEILEGGLAENAVVMSWRGEAGGVKAALAGHDVIMTPGAPCYFDHSYGSNSTQRVYSYNPIARKLRGTKNAKHVLGSQGNVWTEWMNDSRRVEYMILPRMSALAETLWTPNAEKNFEDFTKRMDVFLTRLDYMDIKYRVPEPVAKMSAYLFTKSAKVEFIKPTQPGRVIRYTTDGSEPDSRSPIYDKPIEVNKNCVVKAALFVKGRENKSGDVSVYCEKFQPFSFKDTQLKSGVVARVFTGRFRTVEEMFKRKPRSEFETTKIGIAGVRRRTNFGMIFTGYVRIDTPGIYTFTTGSDDGSKLFLAKSCVVDNDGAHGHVFQSGKVYLEKGYYPVLIGYHQGGGAMSLEALIEGPGIKRQAIGKFLYSKVK